MQRPALGPRSLFPKRRMLRENFDFMFHRCAFADEIIRNALHQAGMGEPMGGMGDDGLITAGELVLTLSARFDPGKTPLQCSFNRLIIAQLEMEEGLVDKRPPIPTIECLTADKV